jgi:hypothetical protein
MFKIFSESNLKPHYGLTGGQSYWIDPDRLTFLDDDGDERYYSQWDFEEDKCKASDTQVGGTHYTSLKIQPLELTYLNFGYEGLKAAIYTKVNKYMLRKKDDEVGQLKKARHCLDLLIEKAELEKEK